MSEDNRPMARVSIILPTYNRATHLPSAFRSIEAQTFKDWELIVVDDGSTDDTHEHVRTYRAKARQTVKYVRQPNQGAYAARNRGLDEATGRYIAFYDSDDTWLPHHLDKCVSALESEPTVDWVFAAYRRITSHTGEVHEDSSFHFEGSGPRPFLALQTRTQDQLNVICDPRLTQYMLLGDVPAALQVSVIRATVFENRRFRSDLRNCEDRFFRIRLANAGHTFAYYDDVHLIYRVHDDNSCAVAENASPEKLCQVFEAFVKGLQDLRTELRLNAAERRALDGRLSALYFWSLGYDVYWRAGNAQKAFTCFHRALRIRPWRLAYWKTYIVARLKTACDLIR